jgi:hypothetical protein
MPDKDSDPKDPTHQREMALSRWDTDGGHGHSSLQRGLCSEAELADVPQLTDTELVHLRVRVIALENMLISLTLHCHKSIWPRNQYSPRLSAL